MISKPNDIEEGIPSEVKDIPLLTKLSGNEAMNLPSFLRCTIQIITLSFLCDSARIGKVDSKDENILSNQISLESSIGILAALVLGPASSVLYGGLNQPAIILGFLSTNFLVISMVSAVLHLLILGTANDSSLVYIELLGRLGPTLTGRLMVIGIIFWIAATIVNMFSQVSLPYFLAGVLFLMIVVAPPATYCIVHSVVTLHLARYVTLKNHRT